MEPYEDYQEYRDKVETNKNLREQIEELEHDIIELRDDLTMHIKENESLSKIVKDLTDENTNLECELEDLKQKRKSDVDEFQDLTDQIEELEDQVEEEKQHPHKFNVSNLRDGLKVELLHRLYNKYNLEQLQYTENLLGIHDFDNPVKF